MWRSTDYRLRAESDAIRETVGQEDRGRQHGETVDCRDNSFGASHDVPGEAAATSDKTWSTKSFGSSPNQLAVHYASVKQKRNSRNDPGSSSQQDHSEETGGQSFDGGYASGNFDGRRAYSGRMHIHFDDKPDSQRRRGLLGPHRAQGARKQRHGRER